MPDAPVSDELALPGGPATPGTDTDKDGRRVLLVTEGSVKPNHRPAPGPSANTLGQITPQTEPNRSGSTSKPPVKPEQALEKGFLEGIKEGIDDFIDKSVESVGFSQPAMVLGALGKAFNEVFMPTAAWELIPAGKGAKILKKGGEVTGVVKKGEKTTEAVKATKPIDNAGSGGHVKKPISLREEYLGKTPGKESRTGKEVQDRMRKEGKLRDGPNGPEFKASDGEWYSLKEADMSHKTDAVKWWNETGREYGAKSKEVRDWMLDSRNYTLDHYSINRSAGAQIPDRYLPPLK